jgi:hypothetical protein
MGPCVAGRPRLQHHGLTNSSPRMSSHRWRLDSRDLEETSVGNYSSQSARGRLRLDFASALKGSGVGACTPDSGQTVCVPFDRRVAHFRLEPAANRLRTGRPHAQAEMRLASCSRASLGVGSFRVSRSGSLVGYKKRLKQFGWRLKLFGGPTDADRSVSRDGGGGDRFPRRGGRFGVARL